VLAGQPCAPALAAALEGAAPASAEADFTEWIRRRMRGVTRGRATEFTLQPPDIEPGELRPGVLARPAHLELPAGDAACEHVLALQLASDGDLAAAAAALERLRAAPDLPAADAAALQTEQRLCLAVDDLRRRWLADHAGKSVELRDGGATVKLNLVSASGGKLVVKDKGKQRELPESALLPGTLAAQLIAPGTVLPAADDEARAFAWLLAADAGVARQDRAAAAQGLRTRGRAACWTCGPSWKAASRWAAPWRSSRASPPRRSRPARRPTRSAMRGSPRRAASPRRGACRWSPSASPRCARSQARSWAHASMPRR
jgi:hypothetical protein